MVCLVQSSQEVRAWHPAPHFHRWGKVEDVPRRLLNLDNMVFLIYLNVGVRKSLVETKALKGFAIPLLNLRSLEPPQRSRVKWLTRLFVVELVFFCAKLFFDNLF